MSADLPGESLEALRARLRARPSDITEGLLAALRHDPRAGARRLAGALERRQARRKAMQRRVAAMRALEQELALGGMEPVAGVDEAGVGPLAGPVVAAAVVLGRGFPVLPLADSKTLSARSRKELDAVIQDRAVAVGIGCADVAEIAQLNVYHAALLAMRRAVEALCVEPRHLLVDARRIPGLAMPQTSLVRGDASQYSIAAASIVAKVHRDTLMEALSERYPQYGFARHKGYGTADHIDAIRRHGPCPEHRTSYSAFERILVGASGDERGGRPPSTEGSATS